MPGIELLIVSVASLFVGFVDAIGRWGLTPAFVVFPLTSPATLFSQQRRFSVASAVATAHARRSICATAGCCQQQPSVELFAGAYGW
jgi:hypothetical protein